MCVCFFLGGRGVAVNWEMHLKKKNVSKRFFLFNYVLSFLFGVGLA